MTEDIKKVSKRFREIDLADQVTDFCLPKKKEVK
jgi:hypothetical protein